VFVISESCFDYQIDRWVQVQGRRIDLNNIENKRKTSLQFPDNVLIQFTQTLYKKKKGNNCLHINHFFLIKKLSVSNKTNVLSRSGNVIVKICYGGATIQKYEYDITVAQKRGGGRRSWPRTEYKTLANGTQII